MYIRTLNLQNMLLKTNLTSFQVNAKWEYHSMSIDMRVKNHLIREWVLARGNIQRKQACPVLSYTVAFYLHFTFYTCVLVTRHSTGELENLSEKETKRRYNSIPKKIIYLREDVGLLGGNGCPNIGCPNIGPGRVHELQIHGSEIIFCNRVPSITGKL